MTGLNLRLRLGMQPQGSGGPSFLSTIGAAAGISTAAAIGRAIARAAASASGLAMAAAIGVPLATAAGAAAGVGAAPGVGVPIGTGAGAAAGSSTAAAVAGAPDVVAYANFVLPSATGNFTISTSDLQGKTPKMAMLALCNAEASEVGFSAAGEESFHTFGATDGTNQWSATSCSESGSNNDRRAYTASACLLETNQSGTTLLEATFVSFAANQVTINITTLNAEIYGKRGFVQFFAGTNCSVEVGVINGETDGAATKTIGFTPEGLLFSESWLAAPGNADTAIQTFGFALNDGSATQYAGGRYLSSGTGEGRVNNKAGGYGANSIPTCAVSFSGADVTATWSTAFEIDMPYAAWSFGGHLTAKAGTITSPTSPGTVTASGLGITPLSALFITGPGAVNTSVSGMGFGAGWLTGSGGGSMGALSKTGYCSTTRLNVQNGADLASLSSFASGQLTLNFTTADATARLIPFIAFGT
ncbi:hypothetical protein GR217_34480 [Rhizobium leguminosarum]|uniref:Uncharacterized protein n=1 Tax=Rhizobium ruizarguesonis TaxID=2081791 RepID=A0AAE4YYR8_9HYPH|nr:hypothetical protein [Rhizobium ruizarguesonis]NEI52728.1 hypothetical protein [Rhizobium ruizarguesonis]